jgi:hypothetical protein
MRQAGGGLPFYSPSTTTLLHFLPHSIMYMLNRWDDQLTPGIYSPILSHGRGNTDAGSHSRLIDQGAYSSAFYD